MKRFSNILLVADAAMENSVALRRAIDLAEVNQAALTIVGVVAEVPAKLGMAVVAMPYSELAEIVVSEKRLALDQMTSAAKDRRVQVTTEVLVGKPFLEIVRKVLQDNHDLVIKSVDPKSSWRKALFGSTDMHLMRKCPCPVWILKEDEKPSYECIVAAVDNNPESDATEALNRQILELSMSLAIAESSELHIVHAWQLQFESYLRSHRAAVDDAEIDAMVADERAARMRWLENLVATYSTAGNKDAVDYLKPGLHVIKGDARHIVPAKAATLGADVVVMGTVARTGVAGFIMGNTAESILTQLECSVLTVKPPGFTSPVTVKASKTG